MGILFFLVILVSIVVRLIGITNSPHTDEAIYQIIGRLGVFHRDWGTLSAGLWMAGDFYIYPSVSALTSQLGGVVGSRLFNIMLGVFCLVYSYRITLMLNPYKKNAELGGLIAAFLVGVSWVSIYVSRLATYDMPSFFLILAGIERLVAGSKNSKDGKTFFQSSLLLFLGSITKIISLPVALLAILISGIAVWKNKKILFYWKRYLLAPFVIIGVFYLLINYSSYLVYFSGQVGREYAEPFSVFRGFIDYLGPYVYLYLASSFMLFYKRNLWLWLVLTSMATAILGVHFLSNRLATLDKHLYFSVVSISVMFGIALSGYYHKFESNKLGIILLISALGLLLFEFNKSQESFAWNSTHEVGQYLESRIIQGDKVLTQEGPPIMLALFDKNFPANITTFDWFSYRGDESLFAYEQAVKDGYFKYVEVQPDMVYPSGRKKEILGLITSSMEDIYTLTYSDGGHQIYERNY